MGKKSKYDGGSVIVSFRLPVKKLDEAKKGIEEYLKRFEPGYVEPVPKGLEWFSESLIKNGTAIDLESERKLMYGTPQDLENYKKRLESNDIDLNGNYAFVVVDDPASNIDPEVFTRLSKIGRPEERIPGTLNKKIVYPEMDPAPGEGRIIPALTAYLLDEMGVWPRKQMVFKTNGEKKAIGEKQMDDLKKEVDATPPEWVKEHKTVIKKSIPTELKVYNCGCSEEDNLFRRNPKCKVDIKDHLI